LLAKPAVRPLRALEPPRRRRCELGGAHPKGGPPSSLGSLLLSLRKSRRLTYGAFAQLRAHLQAVTAAPCR
jgi:hypothetical protein